MLAHKPECSPFLKNVKTSLVDVDIHLVLLSGCRVVLGPPELLVLGVPGARVTDCAGARGHQGGGPHI